MPGMQSNPYYMLQIGMDNTTPTGIPSYLTNQPKKALSLWNWYNDAFIPVQSVVNSGVDLILHWPFGAPNHVSRIDSHLLLDPLWNDSVSELVKRTTKTGANVSVYTGSLQDTPDPNQALKALDFLAEQADIHRCNIIIDAAAVKTPTSKTKYLNGAEAYIAALDAFIDKLHRAGLKFGVEGMWSDNLHAALAHKTDIHFVEFGTVLNSFVNVEHPAWDSVVAPNAANVCVWLAGNEWEKTRAGAAYADVVPNLQDGFASLGIGGMSAIGAHNWYFNGEPGSPRLVISGGNPDCQTALQINVHPSERVYEAPSDFEQN